jgi:hypothetical protein
MHCHSGTPKDRKRDRHAHKQTQTLCLTVYSFHARPGSKCRISHFPNEHPKTLPTPTATMKTPQAKVDGRVALKIFLVLILGTRWGRGKDRFFWTSCLM